MWYAPYSSQWHIYHLVSKKPITYQAPHELKFVSLNHDGTRALVSWKPSDNKSHFLLMKIDEEAGTITPSGDEVVYDQPGGHVYSGHINLDGSCWKCIPSGDDESSFRMWSNGVWTPVPHKSKKSHSDVSDDFTLCSSYSKKTSTVYVQHLKPLRPLHTIALASKHGCCGTTFSADNRWLAVEVQTPGMDHEYYMHIYEISPSVKRSRLLYSWPLLKNREYVLSSLSIQPK